MEKEKSFRKKSAEKCAPLPPDPIVDQSDAFKRIAGYKERETAFLKTLKETIDMETQSNIEKKRKHSTGSRPSNADDSSSSADMLNDECDKYLLPLIQRTDHQSTAALVTFGAIDQLDKLHGILEHLLHMQEQNYRLRRSTRDVDTLTGLMKIQEQINKDSDTFTAGTSTLNDPYSDMELEYNEALLETILAAGNSASNKRNSSKRNRLRSKSVFTDDIISMPDKENKSYTLRRQSAVASDIKAKVSKWTKVKAAFKWERANVSSMNEGKSTDSGIGLSPINNEVARYLRVPSIPCTGSSADSVLSSSSGHLLSGSSVPPTPGTMSSASSVEDVGAISEEFRNNRDSSKSESRSESRTTHEEDARRSRSLDGEVTLCSSVTRHLDKVNPESCSSSQTSPIRKNCPTLMLTAPGAEQIGPNSPSSPLPNIVRTENDFKIESKQKPVTLSRSSRKGKIVLDICSLPEGTPVDSVNMSTRGKPPPSPLNLANRQDSSDAEPYDHTNSPVLSHKTFKWSKVRKPFATANSSAPNSPVQQMEFFGGFDSEELSSGDFSEPNTPHLQLSPKNSLTLQQDEINKKYQELQQQISLEFQAKQKEWERIRTSSVAVSPVPCLQKDDLNKEVKGGVISKPIEENLTPDFKKKLQEWRNKKQQSITTNVPKDSQSSPTKEGDNKKIDWNLWKTGVLKLEGQGLKPLPDEKNLPEDFQRKLDEWKRIKSGATLSTVGDLNVKRQSWKSSQARKFESPKKLKSDDFDRERQRIERDRTKYVEKEKLEKLSKLKAMVAEPPTKEVVVQTSEGVLKFEGISRKFTRKLYEWEKARGIGPEASTFALLHPGYRPLLVGDGEGDNGDESKGSPIARSLSMDSVSPNPSATSISHQPSSLSLNNVDDLKETNSINDRLSSSNPELDAAQDEPEAVIVEVEDDYVETAAPLLAATPMIEQQTPVYRYEQTRKEFCAGNKEPVFVGDKCSKNSQSTTRALQDASELVSNFHDVRHGFKENILHVKTVLDSLFKTLPKLKENLAFNSTALLDTVELVKELAMDIDKKLTALEESEGSKEELDERMSAIDNQLVSLRKTLNFLCKHTDSKPTKNEIVPDINIIPDDMEKNIATVSVCQPPLFHGEVIVNQVQVMDDRSMHNDDTSFTSQRLPDSPTSSRAQISEQDAKRITKSLSNGSKRKTKLRRLGSRQNSKTESDSDEGMQNVVLDAPRRVKRKTSRAKKISEPEKATDEVNTNDDVVYVLKIKPGMKIEQTEIQMDETVAAAPQDTNVSTSSANNVFVKTKRKIFTPIEDTHNNIEAVIGRDIETSSGSERNVNEIKNTDNAPSPVDSDKLVTNLPPIPQSPGMQRRLDKSKTVNQKEPSPAIRFMIAKYERRNSTGTGASSPTAWRSPLMERRIRVQTEKYMGQITKSSSAGNVHKENDGKMSLSSNYKMANEIKGVLKSSSAGVLNTNKLYSTQSPNTSLCRDSLACDSLENIHSAPKKLPTDLALCVDEKRLGFYKKNVDNNGLLRMSASTGAVRKIVTKQVNEDDLIKNDENSETPLDKSDNTVPKIKRKNDGKPPSPRFQHRPVKAYLELNLRNSSLAVRESSSSTQIAHLSDRALKLKKAKDEFLNLNRHCYCPGEEIWKNRLSQISAGSESSNDECVIVKSASVGVMDKDLKKNMGFVSLPRNASRPNNSQATAEKFGLSTIASKLRKVKLRKNSKDLPAMKTVTELCRQILEVDISKQRKSDDESKASSKVNRSSNEKISKSGSANTLGFSTIFRRLDRSEKLKKSKSIGQLEMDDKE